jgi:hypothetical protein
LLRSFALTEVAPAELVGESHEALLNRGHDVIEGGIEVSPGE